MIESVFVSGKSEMGCAGKKQEKIKKKGRVLDELLLKLHLTQVYFDFFISIIARGQLW